MCGHANGKIIQLNVVMFDCQRVYFFGIHDLSPQIWWFCINLSLHQSDQQWRYDVCVNMEDADMQAPVIYS